jgi:hypothetical protein
MCIREEKLQKWVCLLHHVCPHGGIREPLNGFSSVFILVGLCELFWFVAFFLFKSHKATHTMAQMHVWAHLESNPLSTCRRTKCFKQIHFVPDFVLPYVVRFSRLFKKSEWTLLYYFALATFSNLLHLYIQNTCGMYRANVPDRTMN